ncbi:MAG: LysM peptidoglycan-binding domain-containing protein [Bacteroidales bacterium]|nr:LysM peptidoglycan-binding domain-containing protein [Bacteroidales bacterium]
MPLLRKLLLCIFLIALSALFLSAQESIEHKVKWYEDAQTICNRHGISMDELLKANSLQYPSDIKPGMTIAIPARKPAARPATVAPTQPAAKPVTEAASMVIPVIPIVAAAADSLGSGRQSTDSLAFSDSSLLAVGKQNLNAGLALPLGSTEGGNENYADFYGGALLAIDEMSQSNGISVNLTFVDTRQEKDAWNKFEPCDFVIGPVGAGDLREALRVLPREVTVVSPLDPRCEALLPFHRNLIQAPTPVSQQWDQCAAWMKKEFTLNDKLFVLYESGSAEEKTDSPIHALIDSCGVPAIHYSYKILDGRDVADILIEKFTQVPDAVNRVFIASDNQAFVNDAVRNLRILKHNGCEIVLYAPARIKSFETIDVENLHSLSLRMVATYNVDYDNPAVQRFLLKFRALYNTEPTAFAFQGYDLMKYMLILKSGLPDRENQAINKRIDLLQESFLLKKQGQGWINSATRGVVYGPGYNLEMYNNQFISLKNEHK